VITTAANGAAEFLRPDGHGKVLARADDVPSLTLSLEEYLSRGEDPEVRRAAVAAVAHLSWEVTVNQTLSVLEEATAPGRP
jgi:glycosyltransferase involved in cell wall biosynthesis